MNSEKPMKILLIEANPNDVLIIQKMLSEIKGTIFNIESADRLSVGLERLDQKDIDTALLDLSLQSGY